MAHSLAGSLAILALLVTGCGGASGQPKTPPVAQVDTTLGPGDVFDVRVYDEKELTNTYRVDEDGTIDFPLIGRLAVAGLEPPVVADLLSTRLREGQFLKEPQVSILVKEYNSKRYSVMGAVQKPGTFPMTSGMTVVEAISIAGGFTSIASRNNTTVTRKVDGELKRFKVEVDEVTKGSALDFPLQTGDLVFVPERIF